MLSGEKPPDLIWGSAIRFINTGKNNKTRSFTLFRFRMNVLCGDESMTLNNRGCFLLILHTSAGSKGMNILFKPGKDPRTSV